MDLQFYPTPEALARKAWSKFRNRKFERVLEPSAGEGHLAQAMPGYAGLLNRSKIPVDTIEIDISRHPILKEKGFDVVGVNFLKFETGAHYSHIIMNPPFAEGAKHVLHAWDILFDGEIVAIVNAETVRNPFSVERMRLVRLIEKNGEVEFIPDAFRGEGVEREANVDVALIYLRKETDIGNIFEEVTANLKQDDEPEIDDRVTYELVLPRNFVQNQVVAFRQAVEAAKQAAIAEARAKLLAARLGHGLASNGDTEMRQETASNARKNFHERYLELKERAWASILRSTEVTKRLSSKGLQVLERGFAEIQKMEFSEANIYGFLAGLAAKQGEIQMEMVLGVFDEITKYHSDNTVYYLGWKSNDRHRVGMKIRSKRFILPYMNDKWSSGLSWEAVRRLEDFDKVFAMLDGKPEPAMSLAKLFDTHYQELKSGKRLPSDYFDVRYYPKRGTIHFFPTRPDLIDRMNRLVGRHRQWLPEESSMAGEAFWRQYDEAERFQETLHAKASKHAWRNPLGLLTACNDETRREAEDEVMPALLDTLAEHGYGVGELLTHRDAPQTDAPQPELLAD